MAGKPPHENVLAIIGVIISPETPWLIMEYCGLGDLLTVLRHHRPGRGSAGVFSEAELISFARQVGIAKRRVAEIRPQELIVELLFFFFFWVDCQWHAAFGVSCDCPPRLGLPKRFGDEPGVCFDHYQGPCCHQPAIDLELGFL